MAKEPLRQHVTQTISPHCDNRGSCHADMRVLPSERSSNSGPIDTGYVAVRADLRYAGASPQASRGILAMKPEGVTSHTD